MRAKLCIIARRKGTCTRVIIVRMQLIRCSVVMRQPLTLSTRVIRKAADGFSAVNCQIDIISLIGQVSHVLSVIGRI